LKKRSKKLLFQWFGARSARTGTSLIDKVFLLLFVHKKKILPSLQPDEAIRKPEESALRGFSNRGIQAICSGIQESWRPTGKYLAEWN